MWGEDEDCIPLHRIGLDERLLWEQKLNFEFRKREEFL
jgi:hypothetical protein